MTSLFAQAAAVEKAGQAAALCTIIRARGSVPRHVGSKMLVYADGRFEGTIGGGEMESLVLATAQEVIGSGAARTVAYTLVNPGAGDPGVCGGEVEIFVEAILPPATLLIIGAGHVGKALLQLGKWLGLRVVFCDDRAELCNPQAAPGADEYLPVPLTELPNHFAFTTQTYIVMPTRGMRVDVEGLPTLLAQPHAYLGVIGSQRRWLTARKQLAEKGVPLEKLQAVHAPMGLELNAETPEEIALSILAEIVMLRRGGTGAPMKVTQETES